MRPIPERARLLLPRVDPARLCLGWPIGLRDSALLALLTTDLTVAEIAALPADAITVDRGALRVTVQRGPDAWSLPLRPSAAARVLAWLTERRIWGTGQPVFTGIRGPMTSNAIHQILYRYQHPPATRRRRKP